MGFLAKYPGTKMLLRPVEMRFSYPDSFAVASPDAYETLLWDVMNNDPTLFMRAARLKRRGRFLCQHWMHGWNRLQTVFPTTLLAVGGRRRPTSFLLARGTHGERSRESPVV